jgi:hypothetical protein
MIWGWLSLLAGILVCLFVMTSRNDKVFSQSFVLQAFENEDKSQVFFSQPFALTPRRNIEVLVESGLNNTYLAVEGDLVNDETYEVTAFFVPLESYSGVDEGEAWSEGGNSNYTMLSSVPRGSYTLRLEVHGEPGKQPYAFTVSVRQGVPRWLNGFWLFFFLSLVPFVVLLYHLHFEYRRWENSDYSPFASSSS